MTTPDRPAPGDRARARSACALAACCATALAWAGDARADDAPARGADALADLSLEELADLRVTTATRRDARLQEIPAAVWVITQDDIRRSGATSLPEALRLAPGLTVARIDASTWAVSARGFNSRFANKLLVLMDGRTLFSPAFGGVWWEAQGTVLDDVERIEVIRGPGAALWGTNAVNGIVNIITKRAAQTQGWLLAADAGAGGGGAASARLGGASPGLAWRAYGRYEDEAGAATVGDSDHSRSARAGTRVDFAPTEADALTLQAEAYRQRSRHAYAAPLGTAFPDDGDRNHGAFVLATWRRSPAAGGSVAVQAFADRSVLDGVWFVDRRTTFDVDVQHELPAVGAHRPMWGVAVRHTRDHVPQTFFNRLTPERDESALYAGFVQDEWTPTPSVAVTVGAKLEYHDSAGGSLLPNLRVRWTIDPAQSAWFSAARAARQPTRGDLALDTRLPTVVAMTYGPDGREVPVMARLRGNPDLPAEAALALEAGWRRGFGEAAWLDVAAFWTRYRRLREVAMSNLRCWPSEVPMAVAPWCALDSPLLMFDAMFEGTGRATTRGVEATLSWQALPSWRLTATATATGETANRAQGRGITTSILTEAAPARRAGLLRSSLNLGANAEWDLTARYVGRQPAFDVAAYAELNARVAWRPSRALELALVGHDLLGGGHVEQVSELRDIAPTRIRRSGWLQVRWTP